MRKFLDFVARDDRPVLTPPSEDEFEYGQLRIDHGVGKPQKDAPTDPNPTSEAENLKDELLKALRTAEEVDVSHEESREQSGPHHFSSDVSYTGKLEGSHEYTPSAVTVLSETSVLANLHRDTALNNVKSGDVHETSNSRVNAVEPVLVGAPLEMKTRAKEDSRHTLSESCKARRSRPRVRELLSRSDDRLRCAARILLSFASEGATKEWESSEARLRETQEVVSALREIAETMVWADQHEPSLWDTFMECSIMPLLFRCLCATLTSHKGPEDSSVKTNYSVTGGHADVASTLEADQQIENNPNLRDGESLADRTESIPPDSSERQKEPDSSSIQKSSVTSSSVNTRAAVTRATPSSASGEAGAMLNSITDEVSQQIAVEVQSQVLQSLSIMIQSIFRQHSLLCLFSSNHINDILSFEFRFEDDEMLGYFMSAVKTIALKLDPALLQLFFDPSRRAFPLYSTVVRFFDHREQMVRIAVRNITLTIYALGDPEVLAFAARDESMYLHKTIYLLARLCGSVARAFELLLDNGREVRRTRSRTGIFRQKVRISEVTVKLEEIENLFAYLGDVSSISSGTLRPLVVRLLSTKLFVPFFRPVASRASPKAVQLQKRWRLTNSATDTGTPALAVFDAAARCLLLACILGTCRSSCLAHELTRELNHRTPEFENRSVLHALKAMASDITGTERASFVALCAIEAFILCESTTKEVMRCFEYDFYGHHPAEPYGAVDRLNGSIGDGEYHADGEHRKSLDGPLLMTLSEFEAPLTPSNSIPSTPSYVPPSPSDSATPPKDLTRAMSTASLSTDDLAVLETIESDEVLLVFQLGDVSLREIIASILLVVRRREVRTLRIIQSICRILSAVGSKTNSPKVCIEVSKAILDEIAGVMVSFLRNKRTTIVSMERMFDNFRTVAEQDFAESTSALSLEKILSPDSVPKAAEDLPKGAGKRRRPLKDDAIPPTETEDAVVFFVMLDAYEKALGNQVKVEKPPRTQTPNSLKDHLSTEVREILLKCSVDESYLDKRDALEDVASIVLRHREVK